MAARIGPGTVKTTMEVYARASSSADHEAAALLQERFASSFPGSAPSEPRRGMRLCDPPVPSQRTEYHDP